MRYFRISFCIIFLLLIGCNRKYDVLSNEDVSEIMNSPDSIIELAGYTYGLYENTWYTVINGYKGDLVDTSNIIVRLANDGDVTRYNFEAIGLPKLVIKKITEPYYQIELPNQLDSFETAIKLWESNDFIELFFDLLGIRLVNPIFKSL